MKIPNDLEKIYDFIHENILIKEIKIITILRVYRNQKIGYQLFATGETFENKITKFDENKLNLENLDVLFNKICENLLKINTKVILLYKTDFDKPLEIKMIVFGDKVDKDQEQYILELFNLDEKFKELFQDIELIPFKER